MSTNNSHLSAISQSITSNDSKMTHGNDGALATVQQVGVYGYNLGSTNFVPIEVDNNGHLEVSIKDATIPMKIEDLSSTINADHANVSRSIAVGLRARQTIADETTGTFLKCDSSGFLEVNDNNLTVIAPTLNLADTTQTQRVNIALHDSGNSTTRTAKCDSNGFLEVNDNSKTVIAPNLNTADDTQLQRVYTVLHDDTNNLMKSAKCDTNANLLVASSQLPTTLGQKANANCLATCRSSTAGAYDLSARTTIGTASTSTKLLCNSGGVLEVNPFSRTGDTTNASVAVSIAANSTNGTLSLGDSTEYVRYMIDFGASSALNFWIEGSQDNSNWVPLVEIFSNEVSGNYYGSQLVEKPPAYLRLFNHDLSAKSVKIQIVFGRN